MTCEKRVEHSASNENEGTEMSFCRFSALAVVMFGLSLAPAFAAVTHTTSNLNLRGGPGKTYPVRTIIPSGAAIDVHSCGHEWCYSSWADHQGYVSRDYLIHHVVVVVPTITHVTNVHYHAVF